MGNERAGAEQWREILEVAAEGFWNWDLENDIAYLSDKYCDLIGYHPQNTVFNRAFLGTLIHPEDRARVLGSIEDRIEGRQAEPVVDHRMVCRDGRIIWVEARARVVARDARGRGTRMVGTILDITHRKAAEEALRAGQVRYRAMVDAFDGYMYICSPECRIEYLNEAMKRRIGFDALGHHCYKVLNGLDHPCPWCRNDEVFAGDTVRVEILSQRDGRWYDLTNSPIHNADGTVSKQALFVDITDRKKAEIALRESEGRYRSLVEGTPDAVVVHIDGNYVYVNRAAVALLGACSGDEVLGKPVLSFIHPDCRGAISHRIRDVYEDGDESPLTEMRVVRVDGSVLYVEAVGMPIVFNGRPAVMAVLRDITDRKRAEEELALLNAELESRVSKRTAELTQAIRDHESFSYSVSHDLRAPLRHINSYSAILAEDYQEHLPPEAREYLARIRSSSRVMGNLIDHLLELSRVARTDLRRKTIDLSALVETTLTMFAETEPGRRVETEVEQCVLVDGDAHLLNLLVQNLVGNAWKYTAHQEVGRIRFGTEYEGDQRIYFVKDNGVGFDQSYAEKLFTPFERLHGSEFEGAGIGLASAKRIIERHGGKIWGEGAVGQGAAFFFTLATYG
ncbi:PAS domain S-box protein [Geomonas sp. Red32]|uniref:PAS domain-containing sensor histidine kinase n=1 Tax=Geomonas sp. Red32 TaxID=2912856 RepID=UPI00202CD763|nr:PAS domain S-box protein [Geomonas sp. Red32]MCM0080499.1 PAS domain S-box protein [Geomonas sp. Red32]